MGVFNFVRKKIKILGWKIKYGKRIKIGKKFNFRAGMTIIIEKKGKLIIGDNCFFNHNCHISCLKEITIGNDSIFGENVCLYDHNHKYSDKTCLIKNQGFVEGEIKIGSNCWLCSNTVVLKDVTIGDNCVIGANSLVRSSVPSNSILFHKEEQIVKEI